MDVTTAMDKKAEQQTMSAMCLATCRLSLEMFLFSFILSSLVFVCVNDFRIWLSAFVPFDVNAKDLLQYTATCRTLRAINIVHNIICDKIPQT
jgi:hypothetical protein